MDCQYIYIFKGDDTNWNNEQFVTVNVTSQTGVDLSEMTAKFKLGSYTAEYPLTTGSFTIDLSSAVTGQYAFGPICGTIQILDKQQRIKTACNTIPFYITYKVITEQHQTLDIDLPQGSPVSINLSVGGTVSYNDLTDKPSLNGVIIEGAKTSADYGLQPTGDYATQTQLEEGLATKQDVISDLAQIRSNAELGASAVQPSALDTALATKQDKLNASQLTAVNSGVDSVKVAQIATNATEISSIESKIPSQASSSNQLADKNFVNSSIATNTANFIGTFNSVEDLNAYSGTVTNNDYAFVATTDQAGNTLYDRYKYNGTSWVFEYELNNSSFTATQWAAIQSGITSALVTQIGTNESAITSLQNSKQDVIGDLSTIRSGAALGATAVQPAALATKQDTLISGTNIKTVNGSSLLGSGNVDIDALPSQTGQSGKFLTTDGTDASWAEVNMPNNVWTQDNLVAGTNISITQVEKPVIDSNTLVLCHFNDSKTDEISGSAISTPSYTTTYVGGKFANGITGSNKYALIRFREFSTKLTGNYTIDFWVYLTAYMDYMSFYDPSGTSYRFKLSENSFSLGSDITGTGTAITDATYPAGVSFGLNSWHHIAYVNDNDNNKVYFFLDGKAIHNAIRTQTDAGVYQVAYGTTVNQGLRVDELRVSNVARWTSDFTPYSEPYGPAGGATQYQINNTQDISGLIPLTQKAVADGVATLDSNALIPTTQLPTIDGGNANA